MIIMTGALGFIGSALVWEANRVGITDIICVDSVPLEKRPNQLKGRQYSKFLLKDELFDFLNLPETKSQVTWIFHIGANSSTTETNWDHLYENNYLYSLRLFEWCESNHKDFIYASSAATYGAGELGYSDELDSELLKPLNLYGKSKLIFDRWVMKQPKPSIHWYGLKYFNVFGPNEYHKDDQSSVVHKAFHQIKATGKLQLFKSYQPEYKDGEQMRDFVYVKDLTRWMLELTQKKPASGIYNMGFGKARTWVDLGKAVFHSLNINPNIEFIEMPGNLKNQYQYFTEATMLRWKQAGMSDPQWSLEEGTKDYIRNYMSQPFPYL